jgi:CPA1 family monovalent cation:H+ antiporter
MAGVRTIAVMTVSGVRGAVTLAGVLSIPVALSNGARCRGATPRSSSRRR